MVKIIKNQIWFGKLFIRYDSLVLRCLMLNAQLLLTDFLNSFLCGYPIFFYLDNFCIIFFFRMNRTTKSMKRQRQFEEKNNIEIKIDPKTGQQK